VPQLASLAPLIGSITSLGSSAAGLYSGYEQNKYQDMLRSYAGNPQKFQNYAAGFTKPLAAGLVQGVNNQAQGYAAVRGLASSPALEQQIESQAIAPYIQQNQQAGMQEAFQALGLGGGAQPNPAGSFSGLSSGIQGLLKYFQPNMPPGYSNPQVPTQYNNSSDWGNITASQTPPLDMTNWGFDAGASPGTGY